MDREATVTELAAIVRPFLPARPVTMATLTAAVEAARASNQRERETRALIAAELEQIGKHLGAIMKAWELSDEPGDLVSGEEWPFNKALADVHADVWRAVAAIRRS